MKPFPGQSASKGAAEMAHPFVSRPRMSFSEQISLHVPKSPEKLSVSGGAENRIYE